MALPADITTKSVHMCFVDSLGQACSGTVQFDPATPYHGAAATIMVVDARVTATLDTNGEATITLPCTNDPQADPTGFSYHVTERLTSAGGEILDVREYDITLLESDPTPTELASKVPEGPFVPGAAYLTQTAADLLYEPLGTSATGITAHEAASNPHPTYLTQAEGDAAYDALGTGASEAANAVSTHVGEADPHTQYLLASEAPNVEHTHAEADVTDLVTDLAGKMPLNIRRWNGTTWESRPTLPSNITCQAVSDGTHGSTWDPAATAPPDAVEGDYWDKAVS